MPTQTLYHVFRHSLIGDTLFPLANLERQQQLSGIAKARLESYQGRENLLLTKVPFLECTWKEVIFLCAIPPAMVFREIQAAVQDIAPTKMPLFLERRSQWNTFCLDLSELDTSRIVFFFSQEGDAQENQFFPYSEELWPRMSMFSRWTRKYYRAQLRAQERPLYWKGLPHVLYKGTIPLIGREISPV